LRSGRSSVAIRGGRFERAHDLFDRGLDLSASVRVGVRHPREQLPKRGHAVARFRQLLAGVADAYENRRDEVETAVGQIMRALDASAPDGDGEVPGAKSVVWAARALLRAADREHGGFGSAPKFPTPTYLDLLLAAADALPPDEAKDAVSHVAFSCPNFLILETIQTEFHDAILRRPLDWEDGYMPAPGEPGLAEALRNANITAWLDMIDIEDDLDWEGEVRAALDRSGVMIAILSPEALAGLKTLVLPGEMGEAFKVLLATKNCDAFSLPGRDLRSRL